MRRRAITLVGAMAVTAVGVVGPAPPAGAAVVVTSSGTTLSATVTGVTGTIGLSCVSGEVRVLNTPATPSLACSAITSATLTGDGGAQTFGPPFPIASFPALTSTTVDAGGGDDDIEGSTKRDVVFGGAGNDRVVIPRSGADDTIGLGGQDNDVVVVQGTSGSDGVGISTGSPTTQTRVYSNPWEAIVSSTDTLTVQGLAGNDLLLANGVTAASTLDRIELGGGDGDDTLVAGAIAASLSGGTGTNVLTGGAAPDAIFTSSPTDTVRGNGGADGIADFGDSRVGRTIDTAGTGASHDLWQLDVRGDSAVRTRSRPSAGASVVSALARTGRQDLDAGVGRITYAVQQTGTPEDRVLLDIAALPGQLQSVTADGGAYVDLVVPTGTWSVSNGTVTFTGGYQTVEVKDEAHLLVRAPYTDPELRFAHRVIRDTQMRFPTGAERASLRSALEGGTTTRAQAVRELTGTDAYRGLAVDRAFVDILRRTTDAPGRQYWIDRLESGLVLRRLRANLYGSNEYFADAGNTPSLYVAAAYRDILGRTAGPAEIDYWAAQITDVGLPKGTVADRFLNTAEARTVVIRDLFLRWVDREPTSGEISAWNTQLGSSSSDGELGLIRFLAGSAAYFTRADG